MRFAYKIHENSSDCSIVKIIIHTPELCRILKVPRKFMSFNFGDTNCFHLMFYEDDHHLNQLLTSGYTSVLEEYCESLEKKLADCSLIINEYDRITIFASSDLVLALPLENSEPEKYDLFGPVCDNSANEVQLFNKKSVLKEKAPCQIDDSEEWLSNHLGKIEICDCPRINEQFVYRNCPSFSYDWKAFRNRNKSHSFNCSLAKNASGKGKIPWPIETRIPFYAKFTEDQKLRILEFLERGFLIPLSIHNISLIFGSGPTFYIQKTPQFNCILCNHASFTRQHHLFYHIQHKHTNFLIYCVQDKCKKKFPIETLLQKHARLHHSKKYYYHACAWSKLAKHRSKKVQ